MRRMMRRVVADLTDEISECSDGAQAVTLYAALRPDWVLMDIEMKEMDGIAATRRITSDFPEAKIVIVTNYDDAMLRAAAQSAGAYDYILKESLFAVRSLLGGADQDER